MLERAGLIARDRDAQRRPCRIQPAPIKDVAEWAEGFREIWEQRLDRLETYLQQLKARRAGATHPRPTTKKEKSHGRKPRRQS